MVARWAARYNEAVLLPAPVVVDANVLIRNVDYAIRTGRSGALLAGASRGYSLISGVVLFAAAEVADESIRHLPDIAQRRDASLDEVRGVWNSLIVPNVRFVSLHARASSDPRVKEVRNLHAQTHTRRRSWRCSRQPWHPLESSRSCAVAEAGMEPAGVDAARLQEPLQRSGIRPSARTGANSEPTPFQKPEQMPMTSSRTSRSPCGMAKAHSGPRARYRSRCWQFRCSSKTTQCYGAAGSGSSEPASKSSSA